MTIFKHEFRQGRLSLIIWAAAIAFMMAACILIYPQMGTQMDEISKSFAEMGGFSQAFGMDKLNFGEFIGFFGIECGNVLGLGGAFFAALLGVSALAKEEKEHTAEFLLTHPISRSRVITEKLLAVVAQLVVLNLAVIAVSTLSMVVVDVSADGKTLALLYLAYFLMQLEIAAITFGISAFIRGSGMGVGLGLATTMYFVNIIANLMDETKFLKYITPFGYTDGAEIINSQAIPVGYLSVGMLAGAIAIVCAYSKYTKKDIA